MNENEHEAILAQVRTIITDVVDVDPDAIQLQANLREDLRADSLASVEIVMALEDAFGIEISEDRASQLRTVSDLVRAIADVKLGASASAA